MWKAMKRQRFFIFLLVLVSVSCLAGCIRLGGQKGKMRKVEYTIVKTEELPEEIREVVEEQEQKGFRMTFQNDEALYLMRGYGIQSGGGFQIQVESVTENQAELHLKTRLVGPESREAQRGMLSSPSIVVKVAKTDKMVFFD